MQSGSGPAVESVPEQLQCLCWARGLKLLGSDVRSSMLLQDGEVARGLYLTKCRDLSGSPHERDGQGTAVS